MNILLQGAMDEEIEGFCKALENPEETFIGGWHFWKGKYKGNDIVVSRTNIGLANAAASTALGVNIYKPDCIINQGTAGAHSPEVHVGDIVLGEKSINIGSLQSHFASKGVFPDEWYQLADPLTIRKNGVSETYMNGFTADKSLMEAARNTEYIHGKIIPGGVIGSADQWNNELERISWLREKFGTTVEDMETASSALVAQSFGIPFIGIRVVSNSIVNAEPLNYRTALACQEFILSMLANIRL